MISHRTLSDGAAQEQSEGFATPVKKQRTATGSPPQTQRSGSFESQTPPGETFSAEKTSQSKRPHCHSITQFFKPVRNLAILKAASRSDYYLDADQSQQFREGPEGQIVRRKRKWAAGPGAEQSLVPVEAETTKSIVPVVKPAKQRGGRPPKALGKVSTAKYKIATAKTRHDWCVWMQEQMKTSRSKHDCVLEVASRSGVNVDTVYIWLAQKDKWKKWVDQHSAQGKGGVRKRGQWTPMYKVQAKSRGCRMPGKRGYLGPTNYQKDIEAELKVRIPPICQVPNKL